MKDIVGVVAAVATTFIVASIVYQVVKPGSQGPAVVQTVSNATTSLGTTLFKG